MESERTLGGGVEKGHTAFDVGSVSSMPMRMQVRICSCFCRWAKERADVTFEGRTEQIPGVVGEEEPQHQQVWPLG